MEVLLNFFWEFPLASLVDSEKVFAFLFDDYFEYLSSFVIGHDLEVLVLEVVIAHTYLNVAELREEVSELHKEYAVVRLAVEVELALDLRIDLVPLLTVVSPRP